MAPSDMNLRIGKIKSYNNKILVSSSSFNIGTNLKINLDDDKHIVHKQDIKIIKTKLDMKSNKKTNKMSKLAFESVGQIGKSSMTTEASKKHY